MIVQIIAQSVMAMMRFRCSMIVPIDKGFCVVFGEQGGPILGGYLPRMQVFCKKSVKSLAIIQGSFILLLVFKGNAKAQTKNTFLFDH